MVKHFFFYIALAVFCLTVLDQWFDKSGLLGRTLIRIAIMFAACVLGAYLTA